MFDFLQPYFNLNSYQELVSGSIRKILKQFFWLTGGISLVYGSFLAIQAAPKIYELEKSLSIEVQNNFPENLVINWDGTSLNLNIPPESPLMISWPNALQNGSFPKYLAIYDQNLKASSVSTNSSESLFLINQSQIWIFNQTSNIWSEAMFLNEVFKPEFFPATSISSQNLAEKLNQFSHEFRKLTQFGLVLLPIFTILSYWLSGLIFSLTEASFIWLLGKIISWRVSWQKILKLNLAIVPVALSLEIIASFLYPDLEWSFFHLTYWVIFVLVSLRHPNLLLQKPKLT